MSWEETSWWRLELNKKWQNRFEEKESCKRAQSIAWKLKAPIISIGVELGEDCLDNNTEMYDNPQKR